MNKRGWVALVFSLFVLVLLVGGMFAFFKINYTPFAEKKIISSAISSVSKAKSPIASLSTEQIAKEFNETFIYYLLTGIGAQSLHNPPFSDNVPKIKIVVEKEIYSATVNDGKIGIKKKDISDPDIIITTTKAEAAKMIKSKSYISESFKNGGSGLELVAGKATLLAKGYMNIYKDITGKSA